jgi:hypothetical protein
MLSSKTKIIHCQLSIIHSYIMKQDPENSLDFSASPALEEGWSATPELKEKPNIFYISNEVEEKAFTIVPWIGYALLLFTIIEFVYVLTPLQLADAVWTFQTIGRLVERVPVPLLALLLIFHRPEKSIHPIELPILRFLSGCTILIGILYLLMIPLEVINTQQINQLNQQQIETKVSQQTQDLQTLKDHLNDAKTEAEIQQFLVDLANQGSIPKLDNPQTIKSEILDRIARTQERIIEQSQLNETQARQTLIRNSVKWTLGALIAGVWFILVGYLTREIKVNQS